MTEPGGTSFILEDYKPFSESLLWKLQKEYYQGAGVDAWRQPEVPHYITCNPVIGKAYAEIVFAFLRDLLRQEPVKGKVYLLEMGAGSGMFAYHFLKHFEKLRKSIPDKLPGFCYVLCDTVRGNLDFWKSHPRMQPYLNAGLLDFALVDALSSTETIRLEFSGTIIREQSIDQPLLIACNYFFDSIPTDLFYFENGELHKTLLQLQLDEKYRDADPLLIASNLQFHYRSEPAESPVYEEAWLNRLLDYYRENLSDSFCLFPHENLRCLENLKRFSKKGIVLLTSDKGYYREEDLPMRPAPVPVHHGGCFSISVNYHAMKLYCNELNGLSLFPKQLQSSINTCCLFLFPGHEQYPETKLAYERFVNDFSPDDYFNIRTLSEGHIDKMNFDHLMALLRMSGYDHTVFRNMYPRLVELLNKHTDSERWGVFQAIHKVWDAYYPLGEAYNIAFVLAELLFALRFFREAIVYLHLSIEIYGKQDSVLYNLALCHFMTEDFEEAKRILAELLKTYPENENGLSLSKKIEELSQKA